MESGAQADAVVTLTAPQDDLVDEFYIPYVRPLGNLVISSPKRRARFSRS